ncbi:MAG: MFS transporter, partial [Acidimicrobiales bacterium]
ALNFLWGVVGFGLASLVPLYAEQRYHLNAISAGTLLTARAVGTIATGVLTAFAIRRTGFRAPLLVGSLLIALGTFALSVAPRWGLSPYLWLTLAAGLCGLAVGSANPATRNAALQLAPDDVAAVSGLRQMFTFSGIILCVAIVTSILNRSSNPGIAQAHIYWVTIAIIVLAMIPLGFRIPEHKGSW